MTFPADTSAITPAWLTAALRDAGVLPPSLAVAAAAVTPIAEQGATSHTVRIRLEYSSPASAPASLIAKLPGAPAMREVGRTSGIYRLETWFYTRIAAANPAWPVPRCYFAAYDRDTGGFFLLLEDFEEWLPGDLFTTSLDHIRRMLAAGAAIHAAAWERPVASERSLTRFSEPALQSVSRLVSHAASVCRGRWPEFAGPLDAIAATIAADPAVYGRLGTLPRTVVHGDFHLQNALFAPTANDCRLIDWATCFAGPAVVDIARLITTCLPPGLRREHEDDLIRFYLDALRENGVTTYPLDHLRRDYPLGLLSSVVVNTIALSGLDETQWAARSAATGITPAEILANRLNAALADHDILTVIAP